MWENFHWPPLLQLLNTKAYLTFWKQGNKMDFITAEHPSSCTGLKGEVNMLCLLLALLLWKEHCWQLYIGDELRRLLPQCWLIKIPSQRTSKVRCLILLHFSNTGAWAANTPSFKVFSITKGSDLENPVKKGPRK